MFIMPTLSDNFNYNRVATRDEYCYKCLNFLYLDQGQMNILDNNIKLESVCYIAIILCENGLNKFNNLG